MNSPTQWFIQIITKTSCSKCNSTDFNGVMTDYINWGSGPLYYALNCTVPSNVTVSFPLQSLLWGTAFLYFLIHWLCLLKIFWTCPVLIFISLAHCHWFYEWTCFSFNYSVFPIPAFFYMTWFLLLFQSGKCLPVQTESFTKYSPTTKCIKHL